MSGRQGTVVIDEYAFAPDHFAGADKVMARVRCGGRKSLGWIEHRAAMIAGAIAYLKTRAILVSVIERNDAVRRYRASGKREAHYAEDVIDLAVAKGWNGL